MLKAQTNIKPSINTDSSSLNLLSAKKGNPQNKKSIDVSKTISRSTKVYKLDSNGIVKLKEAKKIFKKKFVLSNKKTRVYNRKLRWFYKSQSNPKFKKKLGDWHPNLR